MKIDFHSNIKLLFFFVLILTLASCQITTPADLQLESLSIVRIADEPQLLPWLNANEKIDRNKIKVLKVAFSSETDIVKFAKSNKYHVGYKAYLCDNKNMKTEIYSPAYLRAGNESLGDAIYLSRSDLENLRGGNGRITYFAVIALAGVEINSVYPKPVMTSDSSYLPIYDYQKHISDICIQLSGGAMWVGSTFSSNVFVVPRTAILKTLREE